MKNLLRLLLGINLAALAGLVLIDLITGQPLSAVFLKTTLLYVLLYTNATGIPAVLFLPPIVRWAAERNWPLPFVIGVGSAFFTAVGCFVAGKAIVLLGASRAQTFWSEYFTILRFCVLLAVLASVGVFFYRCGNNCAGKRNA